jgi:hypothetical protein
MNDVWSGIVSVALAIVGIAIIAVIVSKQANTAQVIQAATAGFGTDITAAVSPVTGGTGANLSMPTIYG